MEIILPTFLLILLSIGGLAIGILFNRPPLKGSCASAACLKSVECAFCKHQKSRGEQP